MKRLYLLVVTVCLACFLCTDTHADCRGCCGGHGGIICIDGVTVCADGPSTAESKRPKGWFATE